MDETLDRLGASIKVGLPASVTGHAVANFIRAHWEVNRWGRGTVTPMFEFHLAIREVPPDILKEATAGAKALA